MENKNLTELVDKLFEESDKRVFEIMHKMAEYAVRDLVVESEPEVFL